MVEVRRSTVIDAPVDDVWAILRDFNGHDRWHPAVATSVVEGGIASDVIGAVRDFRLADGSRIKEQLLALSDRDRSFDYCILEAPLPLMGYVASLRLKPVTDGNRTFWEWRSRFEPPPARREELVRLVGEGIYEAGFGAIKSLLQSGPRHIPDRSPKIGPADAAHAIVIDRHGGPDVLRYRGIEVARPGSGEVRIRQHAIGVNYVDIYCRTGYFDLIEPPGILGMEAAGVIESVGEGVTEFKPDDRVGYACGPPGAYADLRVMKPGLLIRLPDRFDDEQVAAYLLKGIAASFLLHDVYAVKSGDTVLVHAAAGGVGLILCQWAAALGAIVIGTASSEDKAARARSNGCVQVIDYTREDFPEAVLRATGGRGVEAVYDAVGKSTFEGSLKCLKPRGHLVSFGQASGDIGAYEIGKLAAKSLTLSRPNYGHYSETAEALRQQADRLFKAMDDGIIKLDRPARYALRDAAVAHEDIERRRTSGSLILIP
jgi:NADPH:quinone reductase